jgi:hypothetical protein
LLWLIAALGLASASFVLEKPDITCLIFHFPADAIPRVDGNASDWAMVPDRYAIGKDQLVNDRETPPADWTVHWPCA